jgi:hypothetical protein
MTLKARAALDKVIARFEAGDLSPLIAVAGIRRDPPVPFDRWSYRNRVLAYAQTDSTDCRGYVQWKDAGRQVRKGSSAAFIWSPCKIKPKDEDEDEPPRVTFKMTPVHPHTNTDGEQDYEPEPWLPPDPPPLAEVCQRLNVPVHYVPGIPNALGDTDGSRIHLNTTDPHIFFHELAHVLHRHLDDGELVGSTKHRESVADFTACVLMQFYGLGDRTGNTWRYIQTYNKDPLKAINYALATVEAILGFLFPPKTEIP